MKTSTFLLDLSPNFPLPCPILERFFIRKDINQLLQLVCWYCSNPKTSLFSETKGKKCNSKEKPGSCKRHTRYAPVAKKWDREIHYYEKAMPKTIQLQKNMYH